MNSLPYFVIALANIIGGLSYLWQKLALDGMPSATIILGRNLIAIACLSAWLSATGGIRLRYPRAHLLRLALIGLLAYAAPLLLGMYGTEWSTASNGSLLILLEPVAILLFARMLLGEHIRPGQAWGLALGLAGAVGIVLEQTGGGALSGLVSDEHLKGNLVLAAHALMWGLYTPLVKPLAMIYKAMDIVWITMVLGLLLFVPAAIAEWDSWQAGPELGRGILYTVVLGLLPSFAGTVMWAWSLSRLPASSVAPFVFLQPLAGVLGGAIVLGETLSAQAVGGALLIALGVVLVIWPRSAARARTGC